MTETHRPSAIDLYCGAGGLSLGLEQAGFDIALAVDKDPYHVATHRRNFPYSTVLCASTENVAGADLLSATGRREIDLICGGPPCQGVSPMGKRYSADPRNTLMDEFARLVFEISPKAVLMETVPGAQMGKATSVFDRFVSRLSEHYRLTLPVHTLNAADFGVPQRRERLFLIGIRNDLNVCPRYPDPVNVSSHPTVWDAIRDLPPLQGRDDLFDRDYANYETLPLFELHRYAQQARGAVRLETDLSYSRQPMDITGCSGCCRVRHRSDIEALYAATAPGAVVPAHNLPRLHPDGISPTLRAGTDSEHGSFNAPRPVHPVEPRCITVREAARLHGYPDWFRFYPRKWHAHRQIGNSVCPPVARAIGVVLCDQLDLGRTKPDVCLQLDENFTLPESSHTFQPRIRQIDEWPKVLQALMIHLDVNSHHNGNGPTFTVDDVRSAYTKSKARMPRTPPDRFLQDIARSRNRHWILAGVLARGLSIRVVRTGGVYGQFVPRDTPGTIDAKDFLAVSSVEISNATKLAPSEGVAADTTSPMDYLASERVSCELFGPGTLRLSRALPEVAGRRAYSMGTFEFAGEGIRGTSGVVVRAVGPDLPSLPAIARLVQRSEATNVVVMGMITTRHFVAIHLEQRTGEFRERKRGVFDVSN